MPNTNLPPSTKDADIVKTLAFPYQVGKVKFPAMATPNRPVFDSITSLLTTGRGERVMRPLFGVNVSRFVFDTITPIMQARIAADVTQVIQTYEPRADVISVVPTLEKSDTNKKTVVVLDIVYSENGQPKRQQVPIPLTTQGQ